MGTLPRRAPSYRLHKATGRGVVTLNGRDVYLGAYGTPESRAAYDRVVAEWLANGRRLVEDAPVTIAELVVAYLRHVDGRYESDEPANIRYALRPVRETYGPTPAADFGPLALKAIRAGFVEAGNCRSMVNRRVRMIVRMFRWAVSEQLVPSPAWEALRSVEGIPKGAKGVREAPKVRPVRDEHVDAVLPFLPRPVRAMVMLQRLTAARPGEICIMRTCDLDMTGDVWSYRPPQHKTIHLDRDRIVFLGPAAQDVLRPFLRAVATEYLFQPKEADAERVAALRAARKSKVQPSQVDRSRPNPRCKPGEKYDHNSYRRAVTRGIEKANRARRANDPEAEPVPHWHPHQLRHSTATNLRRAFDLDVARAVLGHSSSDVTERYAEIDEGKAREAGPARTYR